MSNEFNEEMFLACLMEIGPEPTPIMVRAHAVSFRYARKVEGFFRKHGISANKWDFIHWQRRVRRERT